MMLLSVLLSPKQIFVRLPNYNCSSALNYQEYLILFVQVRQILL